MPPDWRMIWNPSTASYDTEDIVVLVGEKDRNIINDMIHHFEKANICLPKSIFDVLEKMSIETPRSRGLK